MAITIKQIYESGGLSIFRMPVDLVVVVTTCSIVTEHFESGYEKWGKKSQSSMSVDQDQFFVHWLAKAICSHQVNTIMKCFIEFDIIEF